MSKLQKNLESWLIANPDQNAKKLSKAAGLGGTYVRDILDGRSKQPSSAKLRKLASKMGLTLDQLENGNSRQITKNLLGNYSVDVLFTPELESTFFIHGEVQAGRPAFIMDEPIEPLQPFEHGIDADEMYPEAPRFGLRVVGDSMDMIARPGAIAICVNIHDVKHQPQNGDFVVVTHRTPHGFMDATLKEYVVNNEKVELWPRSSNPKHQTPVIFDDHGEDDHTKVVALVVAVKWIP